MISHQQPECLTREASSSDENNSDCSWQVSGGQLHPFACTPHLTCCMAVSVDTVSKQAQYPHETKIKIKSKELCPQKP